MQTSAWLVSFQAKAEIDPAFCCRLNTCECSARSDKRNISLARLNGDLSETCGCFDDRVKNGAELWSVFILSINKIICRSEEEVWVAKSLHHQQRLSIASYTLFG